MKFFSNLLACSIFTQALNASMAVFHDVKSDQWVHLESSKCIDATNYNFDAATVAYHYKVSIWKSNIACEGAFDSELTPGYHSKLNSTTIASLLITPA